MCTHQDASHVLFGVFSELLEPLRDVVVGGPAGEVEHDDCPRGPLVVGVSDGAVPLLSRRVPNLRFDACLFDGDGFGGELDPDGGLGFVGELVLFEAGEEVGLAHSGVYLWQHIPPITTILNRKSKFSPRIVILLYAHT